MNAYTMNLLEEQIQRDIQRLDAYSNEDGSERSKAVQDVTKLIEKLVEAETANEKAVEDQERREIDKNRNESSADIERLKQRIDWRRMILEVAKIIIPTVLPLVIWRKSYTEMLQFEETGRFTSTASKELHLPKIFGTNKM